MTAFHVLTPNGFLTSVLHSHKPYDFISVCGRVVLLNVV